MLYVFFAAAAHVTGGLLCPSLGAERIAPALDKLHDHWTNDPGRTKTGIWGKETIHKKTHQKYTLGSQIPWPAII